MLLTPRRVPAADTGRGARWRAGLREYRWRLVAALALSQTVSYGVLYYSFSVFLTPTAQTLHASTTAMTVALLAGAATMLPVGRHLDRHGGRSLMTGGAVAATLLALAWSRVGNLPELYAVWIGIGAISSAVQYEAAFPVVVSHFPAHQRSRALLGVTVVAGFASSVFLPTAGWLNQSFGWRTAIVILALVHGIIVIPLNAYVRAPAAHAHPAHREKSDRARRENTRRALGDRVFWLLGAGFIAQTGAVATISVLLVTVLRALGAPAGIRRHARRAARGALGHRPPGHHRGRTPHLHPAGDRGRVRNPRRGRAATAGDRARNARRDRVRAAVRARIRGGVHRPPGAVGRVLRHRRVRHPLRPMGRSLDRDGVVHAAVDGSALAHGRTRMGDGLRGRPVRARRARPRPGRPGTPRSRRW